ncbi:hypothetical protein KKE03_03490 [Patescibacteria group bacterium]|nr:hypothetical protein [Patescibacteria group bacterium]
MDYDKNIVKTASQLAHRPEPPYDSKIVMSAMKQALLKIMGYDPAKEEVDDFLLRKNRELEEENTKLKNQLSLRNQKPPTAKRTIKHVIRLAKLKGKQAMFLSILAEEEVVLERELMGKLYGGQKGGSSKLRALKYVIGKKLQRLKDVIVIQAIHGRDGKIGYTLTIKYNNLIKR